MTSTNQYPTHSGVDNTKYKKIPSVNYFNELIANLPDKFVQIISAKCAHIWFRSAIILTMGEVYCPCDYLISCPKEWETEDFTNALKQIVHEVRGFSYDHYIEIDEPVTNFYILEALNYKVVRFSTRINSENEQVFWIDGVHELDGDKITLYFKF